MLIKPKSSAHNKYPKRIIANISKDVRLVRTRTRVQIHIHDNIEGWKVLLSMCLDEFQFLIASSLSDDAIAATLWSHEFALPFMEKILTARRVLKCTDCRCITLDTFDHQCLYDPNNEKEEPSIIGRIIADAIPRRKS